MTDLVAYDEKIALEEFGLNNTGVICHFNSLLQALVSCTSVVEAVLGAKAYMSKTATGQALHDFVWQAAPAARPANSGPFARGCPAVELMSGRVLGALVRDLRLRRPRTRFGASQESASEGLVLLLDMLDDPDPEPVMIDGIAHVPPNPVARLFYHRYTARVMCRGCRKVVSSRQLDSSVQVNLFGASTEDPTQDGFSRQLAASRCQIDGYSCPECGTRTRAVRVSSLELVPEVLVCVFNLYGERRANFFPSELEFRGAASSLRYIQTAQVEHTGSLRSGHYIAKGLRRNGRVSIFNDSSVSPGRFGPSPNVYMVFFHYAGQKSASNVEATDTKASEA